MQPATGIIRELTALFSEKLFIDVPSPETDLIETGLLDSLQLVQLLLHIEQRLGVCIPLEEVALEDLRSIARLAEVIRARTALPA
jgi:acyl carrier protein